MSIWLAISRNLLISRRVGSKSSLVSSSSPGRRARMIAFKAGLIAHGSRPQIYVSTKFKNRGRTVSEANAKVGAMPGRYNGRSCDSPSG